MFDLAVHVRDHIALAASALAFALVAGVSLGIVVARRPHLRGPLLGAIYVARVVPSLAVLAIMLPLVGIGFWPALVALTVLAIPPIVLGTEVGLRSVPESVVDAARGLGMTRGQIASRVEWPLATPIVFSGIRTAAVEVVASATLAAFIGGGGLGEYIVNGLAENDKPQLLEGAFTVALLALGTQWVLGGIERRLANRAA